MNTKDVLAAAASRNDEIAETQGLSATVGELGLEMDGLVYVAEQRALRAVIIQTRGLEGLEAMQASGVALTPQEKVTQMHYASMYLDGIALGYRAALAEAALEPKYDGPWPETGHYTGDPEPPTEEGQMDDNDNGFALWLDGAPLHHLGPPRPRESTTEKVDEAVLPRIDALKDLYTMEVDGASITDDESFVNDLIADVLVWAAHRTGAALADLHDIADKAARTAVDELDAVREEASA
jgi:hypothetical protein